MADHEIPKAYDPKAHEDAVYAAWEQSGFFNPDNLPDERKEMFSIVLPPPNVTGTLHMGHAVMLAIEDIMVRFARMRGKKTLWLPGTDHAAIATQTKVEKLLIAGGMKDPRAELGRGAFLERVKTFATESHDVIVKQCKKMGASLDWSREAYTLDSARSTAVRTAFKMMYDDGLIYRGDRMVNWCPRCKSTLADDEVEYIEQKTKFYYFKYGPVVIGTARPETKFADKVIVVHPNDARYKELVGKEMEVEWIDGLVKAKVVADEVADMDMGSGAMTITPAHSFVDFDLAKKYGFEVVQIIGEDGKLTNAAGSFAGQDAHDARTAIVEQLQKKGLVDHVDENYTHNLSVCYRCESPVEPLPKLQWFIDVNKPFAFRASSHAPIDGINDGQMISLKEIMQHVVRSKQIEIIPERFEKTYFHWIDNLRDWNISRQIWFGHRVPVWYRGEEISVSVEALEGDGWEQDPDTLDTWFSSGLWTISTLGWPSSAKASEGKPSDFEQFHPTSVLETGYDILFFWVARMILMTTYAVGEIPFKQVYLHGLVRDEKGRKMSKSLDNIIDPLDMIGKFGADATRLSLVIGGTPGNDSKLSEEKIAGYRNFTNKLWNIARFVLSSAHLPPLTQGEGWGGVCAVTLADRWILGRLAEVTDRVTAHLERYEFSAAGELLRDFTWSEFADWYLEISKLQKSENTDRVLLHVLSTLLKLWHPFMPFVTEVIWKEMGLSKDFLMIAEWPKSGGNMDPRVAGEFTLVQDVVGAIRNLRSQYNVEPAKMVSVTIVSGKRATFIDEQAELIKHLARVGSLTVTANGTAPVQSASAVLGEASIFLSLAGLLDLEKERMRLTKELQGAQDYASTLSAKLDNAEFTSKAPANVVKKMRTNLSEAHERSRALQSQLAVLKK
ncbi:MAG: valine--tRNA ligase [Patescibacteria group bacterium]